MVDATQGVEAQTVANCYTAIELGVEVLPVLNKMDLQSANPDEAKEEIEDVIGLDATDAIEASAKTGMGIDEILERVVERIPAPQGDPAAPLQALIIDSWFDNYVGVVMLALGTLSSLGYGPLAGVTIIGMQFLDFFDFLTNSVMMPIAAIAICLLVSRVVGVGRIEQEVLLGESTFRRKKVFYT